MQHGCCRSTYEPAVLSFAVPDSDSGSCVTKLCSRRSANCQEHLGSNGRFSQHKSRITILVRAAQPVYMETDPPGIPVPKYRTEVRSGWTAHNLHYLFVFRY